MLGVTPSWFGSRSLPLIFEILIIVKPYAIIPVTAVVIRNIRCRAGLSGKANGVGRGRGTLRPDGD